ncbi:MAG TPA: DUF58 domain-containing protein [Candidatus Eisenbergiella merdipullorum]|uniref:DUF58 domain-containing protein n=1 Tax=Candidatus Eisenbergiella merdipullorum TaxID=2838553 RepID=A0A9D2I3V4_9FIRM|nr:DUF58 domain-containing protein [Candidatus Eisenbergiella merdipullorum]
MKRAVFLLFIIFSFSIAGLYRYPPLLVLSAAEILILPFLFCLTLYFRKHLHLEPARRSGTAEKDTELECEIRIRNKGRLPVSRFGLRIRAWYDGTQTEAHRAVLYGGCDRGENILYFRVFAGHCGLMRIRLERLRVYDYLSLFFSGKRIREEITAAVFPNSGMLLMIPVSCGNAYGEPEQSQALAGRGDSHDEIRQIREYRMGDLSRYIHWNQSARTDTLWIREYERETEETADVFLIRGQSGPKKKGMRRKKREETLLERQDAFYELLSALLLGLLKQGVRPEVHWKDAEKGRVVSYPISDQEGCRELLLLLYRDGFPDGQAQAGSEKEADPEYGTEGFCLTSDLALYQNGKLIRRFSVQGLEQEMEEMTFPL